MANQRAELEWRGSVPVSARFGDPYWSLENGLEEARHVYLSGNGLPDRLVPGFHVAELGFGCGLNLLALLQAARAARLEGPIRYTGFEAHPVPAEAARRALAAFPDLAEDADWLLRGLAEGGPLRSPELQAEIVWGDARQTLQSWAGQADAWFLDGFAPARNPELWTPELLASVARHTAPGGTAATYSAAGHVRRGLQAAGFTVERRPGFGGKRHMTVARLAEDPPR